MKMKLDPLSIYFYILLIMAMVKTQKIFKLNKPIVDLNARPQVTTTPRLPEERRKLPIFPKNMAKFVVTSKPYSKVRTYSPWEISTKKPLMQKMLPSEAKTSKMVPVTRPSISKFTYQQPASQISKEIDSIDDSNKSYLNKIDNNRKETNREYLVVSNNKETSPRVSKINNQFVSRDFEPDAESTNEVSTYSPTVNNDEIKRDSSTESIATTEMLELENSRRKRLSIRGFGEYNNIDMPSKADVYLVEEQKDDNEFIFVKEPLRPVYHHQTSNSIGIEEDLEIATEVIWPEESSNSRTKRA